MYAPFWQQKVFDTMIKSNVRIASRRRFARKTVADLWTEESRRAEGFIHDRRRTKMRDNTGRGARRSGGNNGRRRKMTGEKEGRIRKRA